MTETRPITVASDDTLRQDSDSVERSARLSRQRLVPPGEVPGYKIAHCLGQGAYGSVWLAWEKNTGKQVAIKFYSHRGGLDWSLLNREVEKLAMLHTSRDIVRLNEVGWDAQPPFYVMEFLENGSLATVLKDGPLSPAETVRIAEAVLRALVHAHGSGILHCDIKPANVLMDADMQPRVADFGQSRLSNEQDPALGTLFYMAPEQADLAAVPDARWDVYALGALMYHCLCGHPPFRTPETEKKIEATDSLRERLAVYRRTLQNSERPSAHRRVGGVDKRLAHIVDRCLEIDPARRYPNAQAVLDALRIRARQRARRPLIVMGIVAPVLLLMALVPLSFKAGDRAVATSEEAVVEQATENNKLAAKATARMLESELIGLVGQLRGAANNPELAEAIRREGSRPIQERPGLEKLLQSFRLYYGQPRRLDSQTRAPHPDDAGPPLENELVDTSWFVTDTNGIQLWREPFGDTIDKHWHWRDYFHWGGKDLPDSTSLTDQMKKDIQKNWEAKSFYISTPFVSKETNTYMIAISVLIRERNNPEPMGVLARTIELGKLLSTKNLGGARTVAMVDGRDGQFLDHPKLASSRYQDRDSDEFKELIKTLQLDETLQAKLAQNSSAHNPDEFGGDVDIVIETQHYDPLDRVDADSAANPHERRWLAAFARIPGTDWWTVAQELHDDAIKPVEEVQSELTFFGFIGLTIFLGLIGALWYFLLRGLSNQTVRVRSSRSRGRRSGDTTELSGSGRISSLG